MNLTEEQEYAIKHSIKNHLKISGPFEKHINYAGCHDGTHVFLFSAIHSSPILVDVEIEGICLLIGIAFNYLGNEHRFLDAIPNDIVDALYRMR